MSGQVLLLAGLALLGFAIKLAGVADAAPPVMEGKALSRMALHAEGSFIGEVVAAKKAKDGRPLLSFRAEDGVEALVYVADDAQATVIREGHRYRLRATLVGHGHKPFLTAVKPGALVQLVKASAAAERAVVRNELAVLDGSDVLVPAPGIPDGLHDGFLRVVDGRAKFTL